MGVKTMMFSINLEAVAMMPCNPAIGGTGKGHLVREIDALGGEMGLNIDKTFLQSRMLNTSKGPAVHSLRAQADKKQYHVEMKKVLENQENLDIKQQEIIDIDVVDNHVCGVVTKTLAYYSCKAIVICTGTFLGGRIFIGESNFASDFLLLTHQPRYAFYQQPRLRTRCPAWRVGRCSRCVYGGRLDEIPLLRKSIHQAL
jgi:tRNA uridine 5-carboxymethylaminomethyl modification enzyme